MLLPHRTSSHHIGKHSCQVSLSPWGSLSSLINEEVLGEEEFLVEIFANWSLKSSIQNTSHSAHRNAALCRGILRLFKVRNPDVYIKCLSFSMKTTTVKFFQALCGPNQNISICCSLQPGFYKHSFLVYQSVIYLGVIWLLHLEAKKHSWKISWEVSFKAPLWSQGEVTEPVVKVSRTPVCA